MIAKVEQISLRGLNPHTAADVFNEVRRQPYTIIHCIWESGKNGRTATRNPYLHDKSGLSAVQLIKDMTTATEVVVIKTK